MRAVRWSAAALVGVCLASGCSAIDSRLDRIFGDRESEFSLGEEARVTFRLGSRTKKLDVSVTRVESAPELLDRLKFTSGYEPREAYRVTYTVRVDEPLTEWSDFELDFAEPGNRWEAAPDYDNLTEVTDYQSDNRDVLETECPPADMVALSEELETTGCVVLTSEGTKPLAEVSIDPVRRGFPGDYTWHVG
ncbi:MAG: hypothetical protein QM621_06155 [Aeromicrobium sp.]|uniref:hypothetical protein n=1 Tax=Aeromicrobium sp. TaxID=1871063 RepID=UPI0039E3A0B1